jgi:hypothetical protein
MMSFKQFTVSLVAVAAAVAASSASAAVNQPITATSAVITFDAAQLVANKVTVSGIGSTSVDPVTGVGTIPIASASLASTATGPLTLTFASGAGVALTVGSNTVELTNFVFDNATDTLKADLFALGGLVNKTGLGLLTAGSVVGNMSGVGTLDSVTNSSSTRTVNMLAQSFVLAPEFKTLLGSNATTFAYIASVVQSVKVGNVAASVPEPTTYALMGLGLVGMAFVARRKQQA